jgi:DNA-binding NarL/FixJ family response regulator
LGLGGVGDVETALPLRVFMVEDSPIIRERLTESFTVPGRIEIVGHADRETAAVEALRQGNWEALVLDLQLKDGSGIGVLQALRRVGRPTGSRIIVLTSYANAYYRSKCEHLGADHFFDKAREHHRVLEVLEGMASGRQ